MPLFKPEDPAEPWELPYSYKNGNFFYEYAYTNHISIPSDYNALPADSYESLSEACGIESLEQFFIIPASVRFIGWLDHKVITPKQVLGIGAKAIGLWTEYPNPGIKSLINVNALSSITDIQILLYGKLNFQSKQHTLTIRYNTVDRRKIEPQLLTLRKTLWSQPMPITKHNNDISLLPYKWKNILNTSFITVNDTLSSSVIFSNKVIHTKERNQIIMLNPHELILMGDSEYPMNNYGIDRSIIPRSRIKGLLIKHNSFHVISNELNLAYPIIQELLPNLKTLLSINQET